MDQEGKEKNMNYGSVFDEKRGWGKTEGKKYGSEFHKNVGKEKNMNYGSAFNEKSGWGRRKEKKKKKEKKDHERKRVLNSDSKWIADAIHNHIQRLTLCRDASKLLMSQGKIEMWASVPLLIKSRTRAKTKSGGIWRGWKKEREREGEG